MITEEIWKDIPGYEGLYQVNWYGEIKSLKRQGVKEDHIIKPQKTKDGYMQVYLHKNGKHLHTGVHRLVAMAFLPNPEGLPEVNHINEDKSDNRAVNLEWCTKEYNRNYGTRLERAAKSNMKKVICIETGQVFESVKAATAAMGLRCSTSITNVLKGYRKSAAGYHWDYYRGEE